MPAEQHPAPGVTDTELDQLILNWKGTEDRPGSTLYRLAVALKAERHSPATTGDGEGPRLDFVTAMSIARSSFQSWATKPHNVRWARKIDGTPIPNDLFVTVALAFVENLAALPANSGWEAGVEAMRAAADVRVRAAYEKGVRESAVILEKKAQDYHQEFGSYDRETGVTEYPGNGDEWMEDWEDSRDAILALLPRDTVEPSSG